MPAPRRYPVSALAEIIDDDHDGIIEGDMNRKRKAMKMDANAQHVQPYKLQRPRILKRDFRRHMATLWANVFNSTDYDLMMRFLNAYYEPDVDLWQKDIRGGEFLFSVFSVVPGSPVFLCCPQCACRTHTSYHTSCDTCKGWIRWRSSGMT